MKEGEGPVPTRWGGKKKGKERERSGDQVVGGFPDLMRTPQGGREKKKKESFQPWQEKKESLCSN